MNAPLAYLNGRFLPFAEAALPLHDAGFVSGATVVDNARTFRRQLFRWPGHLARFRRDCSACYIPLEASDAELTAAAEELVEHNAGLLSPGGELQLATFATPGPLGFLVGGSTNGPPTLGMATYPLPFERYRPFFTSGVTLALAGSQSADPADLLPPRVKHRSRLHWHIASQALRDAAWPLAWQQPPPVGDPSVVPVVINQAGAADTSIGSILAVHGDTVLVPVPDSVQESISVKVVRELCASTGLKSSDAPIDFRYFARPVEPADARSIVSEVSELLLAGTGFCLAGVRKFGARDKYRDYTWPGPVFRQLVEAWNELVGVDIVSQLTDRPKY
jgi:branched-chain amino acid aminotransferase